MVNELELVEKVFLKIAFAETDDQLQSSLNGFLAPVLLKLSSRDEQVKNKILELLTHINKRLKSRSRIQLPIDSLLNQYKDEKLPSSIRNFTIIYIKMGYQRADKDVQIKLLPKMLSCLQDRPAAHQNIIIQSILFQLNSYCYSESISERAETFSFIKNDQVARTILDFFSDFLLLPYDMNLNMNDPSVLPPPSLSKSAFSRIKSDPVMTKEQIEDAKLGILKFLGSELLSAREVILHFIVASSDNKYSISDKAEHMIKKFSSADIWEDAGTMTKLLKLYQGTPVKPANIISDVQSINVRLPSSKRQKMKIFPYLLKSKLIVNINAPLCLQVIFEGLFGDDVIAKIKHFALEFIHHICHYCSEKTMTFMAPLFYQALSRVAMDKKEDVKLRSLAFSGFSKLSRCPDIFRRDIALVQKLFAMLEEEGPEIRLSLQDTLSSISVSYAGVTGMDATMMESLILCNVEKEVPSLRLAAVQFANAVFPSTHVLSRYACLLCIGDNKDDVKEEAMRGLSKSKSRKGLEQKTFFPEYTEVCDTFYTKIYERKSKCNEGLVFTSVVYEKLLKYLNECLYAKANIVKQDIIDGTFLQKLRQCTSTILNDEELSDITKCSIGRHLSLINDALVPTGGYSLHGVAMTSLLELVAAVPEKISPSLSNNLDWLQTFLFSPKEDVRESCALLISIVLCTLPENIIHQQLDVYLTYLESKVFEQVHGSILVIGYALSKYFLNINNDKMDIDDGGQQNNMTAYVQRFLTFLSSKLKDSNILLSSACCVALGELGKHFVLPISNMEDDTDKVSKQKIVKDLGALLQSAPESKIKEKAAIALGNMCIGDPEFVYREEIISTLIEASKLRQPELHFTIGEAFSCIGAGNLSKMAKDRWFLPNKSCQSNTTRNHMTAVLHRIIKDCVCSSISYVRQAGVIWLLCIVKFSSDHPAIQDEIKEIQTAFINLLSDSDDVTQDVASRGVGLVYDLVKDEKKDAVVSILVDRLMSGKRPKQTFDSDTQVFEPGVLGSSPEGGNLSTYKELCSLATSMNKPDLMYKFMNLANHNAMWNSRKGAAFGFLSIASLAGDQLKPYLSEIVPKLYRYQYDPNPGIQKSMSNIWSALVPDGKKTVDKYIKEILKDILSNITSNTWRTRESCCLALNDLVKTSSPEDIIKELPSLWTVVFKVMDDIKESVRKAATVLARTLSRLSIRLCDVNQSKLGQQAVQEVLPVLLETGLSSRVAEVKELCLQTLVQVTKNAGALIKPHLAKFVTALLESLSGLEPQYLNTLSLQLSQSQEAQDKLDVIRISASKSSPMMEAVNFCVQYVDDEVLVELTPKLCDLLKTGLGLGTKVGCSTLVISLTLQCRDMLNQFAGKILGALLNGLNDRNNTIKKSYANAIGHLIRHAKEASMEKLLNKLIKWYFEKEDESVHFSCAWCINAMAKYSPDTFYNYATLALPLVFVAKQGESVVTESVGTSIQDLWEEIWNNYTSGNTSAIKLYLTEIYTLVEPLLTHQSWNLREKGGKAVVHVAEALGSSLHQPHLSNFIVALLKALQGRTWKGKEHLLKALSTICTKCRSSMVETLDSNTLGIDVIIEALLKECKKESLVYKVYAVESTASVVQEWKINKFGEFKPIIASFLEWNDDDDDEKDHSSKTKKENLACTSFECLGKVWPYDGESQERHFQHTTELLQTYLKKCTWKTQLSLLKAAISFVDRTDWQLACVGWQNIKNDRDVVVDFISLFIPQVCECIETTTYSSVKLNGVKLLKEFYTKAKDCPVLLVYLTTYNERSQHVIKTLSSSTNFDITNNVLELSKIIAALQTL